jgi:ATP-dependent helicase/nuclease subunit A
MRIAGTAAHRALEHFPIERWGEPVDRSEVDRLLAGEAPTGDPVGEAVGANVSRFLGSRYAARVRQSGGSSYREEPFVLELGSGREKLRLRGTIDLMVGFADGSVDVVDYKSSSLGGFDENDLSGEGARTFQLRAYGLAAWKRYDFKPVRAGIVDLSSAAEPPDPTPLGETDLTRFETRLLELRGVFVAARSQADFSGLPRERCLAIRCGFIRACHG